ncbi:MAG TPA: NrtA/SsuA/CpmA family ABC transporter substrate-binding protein [Chthoniobacterales bacterium]|nr:NrtA/SsuA/CpmA family ABC transporter substrate-binding protein [Chthoniobacterales bacterium]
MNNTTESMNKLRTVTCALALLGSIMFFIVVGCRQHQSEPKEITIGTFSRAIDYAPYYVARHFKWFEEQLQATSAGITISYREFGSFPEIAQGFQDNTLGAFFSAEAPATILRAQPNDIRVVEVGCTLQQEVVVRRDLPVKSVADLRGRKIAVLKGTSSHYGLLNILKANGLKPEDVTIQDVPPPTAQAAFQSGDIDAWAVWPPFVEEQEVSGKGLVLKGGDAVIQSVMSEPQRLISTQRAVAQALVAAIQRAKDWIQANPEEAVSIVSKELKIDPGIVKLAWPKHNWAATLSENVTVDIEAKAKFLSEQKDLVRNNQVVNVRTDLLDTSFVRK